MDLQSIIRGLRTERDLINQIISSFTLLAHLRNARMPIDPSLDQTLVRLRDLYASVHAPSHQLGTVWVEFRQPATGKKLEVAMTVEEADQLSADLTTAVTVQKAAAAAKEASDA